MIDMLLFRPGAQCNLIVGHISIELTCTGGAVVLFHHTIEVDSRLVVADGDVAGSVAFTFVSRLSWRYSSCNRSRFPKPLYKQIICDHASRWLKRLRNESLILHTINIDDLRITIHFFREGFSVPLPINHFLKWVN